MGSPALPASRLLGSESRTHPPPGPQVTGHLRLGTSEGAPLSRPLSGQTCIPGGQMLSTQMLAHGKGHSATLIFTVCLENAPKSKGIEATTISKVTAHNPGGPGATSASESWALGPRHLASAAASGKVGSALGSARRTATPLLSNGSDDSSPGGSVTVEGSDGQNQERSQDTAHNTHRHMLHTCTRDNFRENTPLHSGLHQTEAGNITGSRGARAHLGLQKLHAGV